MPNKIGTNINWKKPQKSKIGKFKKKPILFDKYKWGMLTNLGKKSGISQIVLQMPNLNRLNKCTRVKNFEVSRRFQAILKYFLPTYYINDIKQEK
jgi:hypothetical protein